MYLNVHFHTFRCTRDVLEMYSRCNPDVHPTNRFFFVNQMYINVRKCTFSYIYVHLCDANLKKITIFSVVVVAN